MNEAVEAVAGLCEAVTQRAIDRPHGGSPGQFPLECTLVVVEVELEGVVATEQMARTAAPRVLSPPEGSLGRSPLAQFMLRSSAAFLFASLTVDDTMPALEPFAGIGANSTRGRRGDSLQLKPSPPPLLRRADGVSTNPELLYDVPEALAAILAKYTGGEPVVDVV